jgi:hypothetical protein
LLKQTSSLEQRVSFIQESGGMNANEVDEYVRTELIRKSINDVKVRA